MKEVEDAAQNEPANGTEDIRELLNGGKYSEAVRLVRARNPQMTRAEAYEYLRALNTTATHRDAVASRRDQWALVIMVLVMFMLTLGSMAYYAQYVPNNFFVRLAAPAPTGPAPVR